MDKLDLNVLTNKLVTGSSIIAQTWRTQRNYREYIDKLVNQLTISKKEQEKLRKFQDRLADFQQYLLA